MKTPMSFDELQKRADRLTKQYSHDGLVHRFGNTRVHYWYVMGITSKGKTVIIGPFSETEAESEGAKLLDAELFSCDTVNISEATRQIKAELIRRGIDPDEAVSRMSHKISGKESAREHEVKERNILSKLFRKKNT